MPHWFIDASDSLVKSLSVEGGSSNMPDLEIDPYAMALQDHDYDDMVDNINATKINNDGKVHNKIIDKYTDNKNKKLDTTAAILTEHHGSFVYDPVFGVISREIRDLWEKDTCNKKDNNFIAGSVRIKKEIPSVRFR